MLRLKVSDTVILNIRKFLYFLLMIILCLFVCKNSHKAFEYHTDEYDYTSHISLKDGVEYVQNFRTTEGLLKGISIRFGTYQHINQGKLLVKLSKEDETIHEWKFDLADLKDNAYQDFYLDKELNLKKETNYSISVRANYEEIPLTEKDVFSRSQSYSEDSKIAVFLSPGGDALSGQGDNLSSESLCYQLICENAYVREYSTRVFLICLVIAAVVYFFLVDFRRIKVYSLFICFAGLILVIEFVFTDLFPRFQTNIPVLSFCNEECFDEIAPNKDASREFDVSRFDFNNVEIAVQKGTADRVHIILSNTDCNEVYIDRDVYASEFIGGGPTGCRIRVSVRDTEKLNSFPKGNYSIKITNLNTSNPLKILMHADDEDERHIDVAVNRLSGFAYYFAYFIIIALLFFLFGFFTLTRRTNLSAEKGFIIVGSVLSLFYLILMLPWTAPDSSSHFKAAYRFSSLLLGQKENEEWSGREEDAKMEQVFWENDPALWTRNPDIQDYMSVFMNIRKSTGSEELMGFAPEDKMKFYSIISYFPQTIGLYMGRVLHLNFFCTLYLARIIALLFYLFAGWHMVHIAPAGKLVFAGILLMPMPLMLSSSFSYDMMVIISALAFTACILRLAMGDVSPQMCAETMIWTFIAGAVKGGGNLILLPLVLLILKNSKLNRNKCIVLIAFTIIAGLSSILIFDVILPKEALFQFGSVSSGKLRAAFAFKNPMRYLMMTIMAYINSMDQLFINMGGTILGWGERVIPDTVIGLMLIITGLSAVSDREVFQFRKKDRALMLGIIFLEFFLMPVMLLSWTSPSSTYIEGLQGRYYLPVLPLIYFVCADIKLVNGLYVSDQKTQAGINNYFYRIFVCFSCICIYYMMRLYLTR